MGESEMTTKTGGNKDVGEAFVRAAVPLMKEYTEKLEKFVQEAESLQQAFSKSPPKGEDDQRRAKERLSRIEDRASHLSFAVDELNRRVSQMIEQGQLDSELQRVELKLRLAELENAMNAARWIDTTVPRNDAEAPQR
jgi:hypothetical protein